MDKGKKIKKVFVYLALSFGFLLLFSGYTSPLFPRFMEYDSAVFMMDAKSVLSGKRLYAEVFDHKGPIFFGIETIGMLGGRTGVFFIQILFLTANLFLWDKLQNLFAIGKKRKIFATACMLMLLVYTMANGNLTEEYSLPGILLCLYLFIKDLLRNGLPSLKNSYLYGVCLGLLAFVRLNNAVTVCAIVLYWIIYLCKKKCWHVLFQNLGMGLLGILTVTIPVLGYFMLRGTLYDMLYATFLFNLTYSSDIRFFMIFESLKLLIRMLVLFLPLLLAIFICFRRIEKKELAQALILIIICNILTLFLGQGYNHYFTIAVPVTAILFIVGSGKNASRLSGNVWDILEKIGMVGVLAVYLILAVRVAYKNVHDYYVDSAYQKKYDIVKQAFSSIPEAEQDEVLGYEIPADYYLIGNLLPCHRYGILQNEWASNDPQIMADYLAFIREESPKWLAVAAGSSNPELEEILTLYYTIKDKNEFFTLYHVTE